MKYIKNDKLYLGSKEQTIKNNLKEIIKYIYYQCPLDYDQMKQIYKYIETDCEYDDYDLLYYEFETNLMQDNKYAYELIKDLDNTYKNEELINELHNYLLLTKSPKKLRLNNIRQIQLINNNGINKDSSGIRDLDWKLHFWDEYMINNDDNIRFHDLIIAVHKIKSHKFDNWYELYTNISEFHVLDHGYGKKKDIIAVIKFDHRS